MNKQNIIYLGDCLSESDKIESGSVDLILTDLPYGTMIRSDETHKKMYGKIDKWDFSIEPKRIFEIANRILRNNGKMVLFSQEPYTTKLVKEAIPNIPFSYRAIWEKDNFAVALGVNKAMVGFYEDILVFSKTHYKHDFEGKHPLRQYFFKMKEYINSTTKEIDAILGNVMSSHYFTNGSQFSIPVKRDYIKLIETFKINEMQEFKEFAEVKDIDVKYRQNLIKRMNEQYPSTFNLWQGNKFKSNILKYKKDYEGLHPTQKPVLLLEDLIKTFSNENNLVVDLTTGSASVPVACINTNRRYIAIEKDEQYYNIAINRISGYIHID